MFPRCHPAFPRCHPAFPRRYPAFPRHYYPSVPHLLLLSLATDSRTHYTTYLVQHSNPLVLDSDTWSAPPRNKQVNWNPRRDQFGDLFLCLLACLVSLSVSTRVTTSLRLLFEPSTFPHPSHPHLPPVMTRTSRRYPCRDRSRSRSCHRSRNHSGRQSHYRSRSRSHNRRHRRDYRRRSPSNDYFRDSSSDRSRSCSRSQRRSRWSSRDCSSSRSRTRSPQRRSDRPAHHRSPRHQRAQSPAPAATPLGSPPAAATSTEGCLLELLCRVIGVSQPTLEPQSNPYPTPGFYTPGGVFSNPPGGANRVRLTTISLLQELRTHQEAMGVVIVLAPRDPAVIVPILHDLANITMITM